MMRRHPASSSRGFTLVELLVVVAMVGILAALAIVGFRKYVASAGIAEPKAMIQLIRHGETQYKLDAYQYLGCAGCGGQGCAQGSGSLTAYYPAAPTSAKHTWRQPVDEWNCWRQLNVPTDGVVRFGYAVVAGGPNDPVKQPVGFKALGAFSPIDPEPWYVIQAAGDRNDDNEFALLAANSWSNEVYYEDDTE